MHQPIDDAPEAGIRRGRALLVRASDLVADMLANPPDEGRRSWKLDRYANVLRFIGNGYEIDLDDIDAEEILDWLAHLEEKSWCSDLVLADLVRAFHRASNFFRREWQKPLNERLQERIRAIKRVTPCADCGQTFPPEAMDFDHLPGETKSGSISQMTKTARSEREVSVEMLKCQIVCAVCHRIRTAARRSPDPIPSKETR